jgi:hypothetical protein
MRKVLVAPIATLADELIAASKTTNNGRRAFAAAGRGFFGLT